MHVLVNIDNVCLKWVGDRVNIDSCVISSILFRFC